MSCATLSTQILERDESKKNVRLSKGQDVFILVPRIKDNDILRENLEESGFSSERFCNILQQELLKEINSREVNADSSQEKKGNSLEIEIMEIQREDKFLGLFGENKAKLRANIVLIVDGNQREFESVTYEGASSTSIGGIEVSSSDPVKTIAETFSIGVASNIIK